MREDLNQDGDESDCSPLLGDDDGEHQARMPQVSLNGDGDGDGDSDSDGNGNGNGDGDGDGDGDSDDDGDVAV